MARVAMIPLKAPAVARLAKTAKAGRHNLGGNLFLQKVSDNAEHCSLVLRIKTKDGKATEIGGGTYDPATLADARAKAKELSCFAGQGSDPLARLRAAQATVQADAAEAAGVTFGEMVKEWLMTPKNAGWSKSHRDSVAGILRRDCAIFDARPVASITDQDVLTLAEAIWKDRPTQMRRTVNVLYRVFARAKFQKLITVNPAVWRGELSEQLPKDKKAVSYRSIPRASAPAAFAALSHPDRPLRATATRFMILTGSRSHAAGGQDGSAQQ